MQLHELEIGRLAYQAKINSVLQYNLSSSSERVLGLPTDCMTTSIAADGINNNNSSSSSQAVKHFLAKLNDWDKIELEENLKERVKFTTQTVAKLITNYERFENFHLKNMTLKNPVIASS